jgi:adenylate kinase family enzyme
MDQKQEYPSELILRIIKRILSLYGPRKYLLEGFPRNQADVTALSGMCTQFERVELMGYINIDMTEQQMKDSGMKALKELKKEESQDSI